jgi:hypothetical protein
MPDPAEEYELALTAWRDDMREVHGQVIALGEEIRTKAQQMDALKYQEKLLRERKPHPPRHD